MNDTSQPTDSSERGWQFSLRTLFLAITVVGVVLAPANWFGGYYLLPAGLSLTLVGASIWAYAAGRPVVLLALAVAAAVAGFMFGLVPFTWHAVLILFLGVVSLIAKPGVRRFAVAILVVGIVPFGLVYGPDLTLARLVKDLRTRYPLRSISTRLISVRKLPIGESLPESEAAMSSVVRGNLEEMETYFASARNFRAMALETLHNSTYRAFVQSPGFGFERMRTKPILSDIEVAERQTVELPLAINGTFRPIGVEVLSDVHRLTRIDFLIPTRMGYVSTRGEAAGFEAHGFNGLKQFLLELDMSAGRMNGQSSQELAKLSSQWQVMRLELVSLLRHDEPRVYVSNRLPQMDQLTEVPHRALDDFERDALPQLRFEKDIVTDIADERIKMLGSIRAGNDCLQCHEGDRGLLLGAFSYELVPTASSATARHE
jgi:hypothetical protein